MGMLRAGLAAVLRAGVGTSARGAAMRGAALRGGAARATAARSARYTIPAAAGRQGTARVVGSGASRAATASAAAQVAAASIRPNPRADAMRQAPRQAYQAAIEKIRHVTHSSVVTNTNTDNSQTNSNTDNSVNNSYNQSQDGQDGQPIQQQPVNNSQSRVAEDSPRVFLGLEKAATRATLGLAAVGFAAVVAVNQIHRWGEGLAERQRYLTDFNGNIAASFAQLEARRIGRNINRGQGTSGSTKYLNTSLDKLEEKLLPYQQFATNAVNTIAATVIEKLTSGIDLLESIASSVIPEESKGILKGIMTALGMLNPQVDPFDKSATKAMIDLANQQPRRRANPPGP